MLLGLWLMLDVCNLSLLGSYMPILISDSKTMIQKEEEMSRITVVQMDKLRDLLGIRRMD